MPARIEDGADFNNPDAWGFCDFCAFEVAVTIPDGVRVDHQHDRNGCNEGLCPGSDRVVAMQTPYTAKAREIVNLYKGMSRAKSRAFWQKQRSFAREKARKGAPKVNPNYVALLGQDGVNDVE